MKRPKRPRDINQLAASIVADATQESSPPLTHPKTKPPRKSNPSSRLSESKVSPEKAS